MSYERILIIENALFIMSYFCAAFWNWTEYSLSVFVDFLNANITKTFTQLLQCIEDVD